MTEDTVSLSWEDPKDDGGCLVTQFVLESREGGKRVWQSVDTTGNMEYTVTNLKEGTTYSFQVAAENEVGVGSFVELKKSVAPKSQHGEYLFLSHGNI